MIDPTISLPGDFAKEKPEDDLLGRAAFCRKLARILMRGRSEGSSVVALYGDWGVGKTTIKNFTKHYLRTEHKIEPIDFDPWSWSGRDKVIDALFRKIGGALGWTDKSVVEQRLHNISLKLGLVEPFIDAGRAARTSLVVVFGLIATCWAPLAATKDQWMGAGAIVLAGVATVAVASYRLLGAVRAYYAEVTTRREANLDLERDELKKALESRTTPLVVIVDDVDRLVPSEICQVMQVVKTVANLPNVVFLLLFQRETIERALDDICGEKMGRGFLEKIVQLPIHVPEPESGKVLDILEKGLAELRRTVPAFAAHWDAKRWRDDVLPHVRPYFVNLRNVIRFFGSLRGYIDQHLHSGSLEVNPVDLVAIETLRMFEPEAFESLALTPLNDPQRWISLLLGFKGDDESNRRTLDLDRLTKLVAADAQPGVRSLLSSLFPQLREQSVITDKDDATFDRDLRVCHPNHFRTYFELRLPTDRMSAQDFSEFIEATASVDRLLGFLHRVEGRRLFRDFIARVRIHLDGLDVARLSVVIRALFDHFDSLPHGRGLDVRDATKATALHAIIRLGDATTRYQSVATACKETRGLDLPVRVVWSFEKALDDAQPAELRPVEREHVDLLRPLALAVIQRASEDGRLWASPWVDIHLVVWRAWQGLDAPRNWLTAAVVDGPGALSVVCRWLGWESSTGGAGTRYNPILPARQIDEFIAVDRLLELIRSDRTTGTTDVERDAISLLEIAVAQKGEGNLREEVRLRHVMDSPLSEDGLEQE